MREVYLHLIWKETRSRNSRKWIFVICLIDRSGAMLVWMLKMVQEAETPSLTQGSNMQNELIDPATLTFDL